MWFMSETFCGLEDVATQQYSTMYREREIIEREIITWHKSHVIYTVYQ